MEKRNPIKRHKYLQPFSREHHHSLLLCWKIRTGFTKDIDVKRIKKYADWFFENYIREHFEIEEKHIFTILGNDHKNVQRAIEEHRKLETLFQSKDNLKANLSEIEKQLDAHIRFEERQLFNEVQEAASEAQLQSISKFHQEKAFQENTEDEFWR
ncbi:MAG: hypothetical protein WD048_07455 [Chitinophagales bacterium]